MRASIRRDGLLLTLIFLASWLCTATTVSAQSAPVCQFILGFQTLHDLDSADIGDCIDNQAFAANGDAQQHTTKGLMAWRKADNWTAFTNGYMTWIYGPDGLVSRLNTDRFPWENDQPATASQPPTLAPSSNCPMVTIRHVIPFVGSGPGGICVGVCTQIAVATSVRTCTPPPPCPSSFTVRSTNPLQTSLPTWTTPSGAVIKNACT